MHACLWKVFEEHSEDCAFLEQTHVLCGTLGPAGGEVGGGESAPLFGPIFLFLEGKHEIHLSKPTLVHG